MIARTVAADPSLPHQIRLRTVTPWKVAVSCNCRESNKPFGILGEDGATVWEIYHAGEHDSPLTELVSGERTAYAVT
jgi:hypothetical protein